jgi:hypothetical protein
MDPTATVTSPPDQKKDADAFRAAVDLFGLTAPRWYVAGVRGAMAWPLSPSLVVYRGQRLILTPPIGSMLPAVVMPRTDGIAGTAHARQLVSGFLSSLAWVERDGVRIEIAHEGPFAMPPPDPRFAQTVARHFDADYLPEPSDQRGRIALALYREGLNLTRINVAYAFLSFYKVINYIRPENGAKQKKWITAALVSVRGRAATDRLAALRAEKDVAHYLYVSCRCAVAHAGNGETVDPEDPEDERRLRADLPLIRELAEIAIEQEIGIKSARTVYEEHLYELAGFKEHLGQAVVDAVLSGPDAVAAIPATDFPVVSIGLVGKPPYEALTGLEPRTLEVVPERPGLLLVDVSSTPVRVAARICLDFAEERLVIDAFSGGIAVDDDGSSDAARAAASVACFQRDLILNGRLEVRDAETGRRLGRKDGFIPLNIDPGRSAEALQKRVDHFLKLASERDAGASDAILPPEP